MRAHFCKRKLIKGYTLIELALVLIVIALLSAFAMVSLGNTEEQRDATMVQSAQASLQTIVSQGAARMDVTPSELRDSHSQQILYAIQATVGQTASQHGGVQFAPAGKQFVMTIEGSGRQATFDISNTGDVRLIALNKFTSYKANANGYIEKI